MQERRVFCLGGARGALVGLLMGVTLLLSVGAQAQYEVIKEGGVSYSTFKLSLVRERVELISEGMGGEKLQSIGAALGWAQGSGQKVLMATNAGMFHPNYEPVGLQIEQGRRVASINLSKGQGNFFLKPNGIFVVSGQSATIVETSTFVDRDRIDVASQSGPLLLANGVIHSAFKRDSDNRAIRSGVGVYGGNSAIFVLSDEPVTFYELATLFKVRLGCSNALFLDGTISTMYVAGKREGDLDHRYGGIFLAVERITRGTAGRIVGETP